jgi:hypothetical protein
VTPEPLVLYAKSQSTAEVVEYVLAADVDEGTLG